MKTRIIHSILALMLTFMALPMMGQDYLKIYFKDGHTERHYMKLVESISATKYDLEGNLHSDYQMQQIVMPDTTYSYYIADIDSMAFRKVDEEQLRSRVTSIQSSLKPIFEQCSTIEEMEEHIDEIKKLDGIEDVWRSGTDIFVQIRDWHNLVFMYPVVPEEGSRSPSRKTKSLNDQKPQLQQINYKVAIACQMINDSRFEEQVNDLRILTEKYNDMGAETVFVPSEEGGNFDLDFFRRRMYDYDIVILDTHGCYDDNSKLHGFLTDEYLGISTPEIEVWNWLVS